MNELDYKIFKERGILIVPESGVSSERLTMALKVELARNFGVYLSTDSDEISDEFVMEFFWWLFERGELKSQPYFPNILPVNRDGVDVGDLLNRPSPPITSIYRTSYIEKILSLKNPDQLELEWISGELSGEPTKLLTKFLSVFLKKGKIRARRVERKRFMDALERVSNALDYKIDLLDLWKKVALWIHPSEYPEYPHAQSFLFWILRSQNKNKKEPEKSKLRKLMWKGWEEGKDFDVFESYRH